MFKRILVAVDGSSTANRGLRTALALAAEHDASLYAVHVIDEAAIATIAVNSEYMSPQFVEGLWEGAKETGQKVLERAQAVARKENRTLVPRLVEGRGIGVAHAILAEARKVHADVIVLGTHGRRGLRRLVLGSDAENVVREAKVPVLLVHSTPGQRAGRPPVKSAVATKAATPGLAPTRSVH